MDDGPRTGGALRAVRGDRGCHPAWDLALVWGSITPDDEPVLWPFDGEYWRDEIGTSQAVVQSACACEPWPSLSLLCGNLAH
jgi:hypothetical protein